MKQLAHKPQVKALIISALFVIVALATILPAAAQGDHIVVAEIEGPVTPAMASYFDRVIQTAEDSGALAALIVLDTPGGAVNVTLEIVQSFRNAEVPIIVYIGPAGAQAASAGSVITVAAHAAGMAPETVIGAASPVGGSGEDIEETLFQKITEDLKATMRNLTERRGEEAVILAEAMIDEARAVTANEALESALIDAVAIDVDDLLRQLDGLPVEVKGRPVTLEIADADRQQLSMSLVEQFLHALSNPLLIGLLMTIGVQAILIEIGSPGGWAAGFIGVLCLGLGLYGLGTLPANWLGLGLIAVAFVLFFLEVKTPATGILAVAGTITLLAGLLVLFNSPGSPEFARISIAGALGIAFFTAGFFIFLVAKALNAQLQAPSTGAEGMVDMTGTTRTDMVAAEGMSNLYSGTVLVNGEVWRALSERAIEEGERVIVKSVEGITLHVKLLES
jgi:membrane-bound serine protease (ClpP class)